MVICDGVWRGRFGAPVAGSLPTIVRAFKSATTKRINEFRRSPGTSVWQRDYYEHVIRTQGDLSRIRSYIAENPARWAQDEYQVEVPHAAPFP